MEVLDLIRKRKSYAKVVRSMVKTNLSMKLPNLQIKFYHRYGIHRYVCIGKNIIYVGFGTTRNFRHPLGVLEGTPHG